MPESSSVDHPERVIVAIAGAPGGDALLRRAARIAQRSGAELIGLHIRSGQSLAIGPSPSVAAQRDLLQALGGEYREVNGDDIAATLARYAREQEATQIVLGSSRRSRWLELTRGSVVNRVVRLAGDIDVHVISYGQENFDGDLLRGSERLHRQRQIAGAIIALAALPLLTFVLTHHRERIGLATDLLLYLLTVLFIGAIGGRVVAFISAVVAFLLANWYLTPPLHTWSVQHGENLFALVLFVAVTVVTSHFISVAATRAIEARKARSEAETFALLAASATLEHPLAMLVDLVRSTFGLDGTALRRRSDDGTWTIIERAGELTPPSSAVALPDNTELVLFGPTVSGDAQRVLRVFATHLAAAIERSGLEQEAARAELLEHANALRSALLQSVSHDLRTPLAGIKAAVSSLRQPDVELPPASQAELLELIETDTDRLTTLVTNLLDLSRIQAGALSPRLRPVALEEVVPAALHSLGVGPPQVRVDLDPTLPDVRADAALLERVIANLVSNAVTYAGPEAEVAAHCTEDSVLLTITDHGPGIPAAARSAVRQPFQRMGDSSAKGVGLGLAIASGFVEAMHAELRLGDTPDGGLTVTVKLSRNDGAPA